MCQHNTYQCLLLQNDYCSLCLFQNPVKNCAGIRWEPLLPWSYVTVCHFATATCFKSPFPPSLVGTFLYEMDALRIFELVFHIRHCLTAWNYWIPSKLGKKKIRAVSGCGGFFCLCPNAMSGWNKVHSISPILLLRQCPGFHGKENLECALKGNCSVVKEVPAIAGGGSRSAGTCLAVETELASQDCLILSVDTNKLYCLV